jgi:hypothetical protein
MATEPISGGLDGAVTGDGAVGAPLPGDVARLLSYLAHVIDERVALRAEIGTEEFVALHLGVGRTDVVTTSVTLTGLGFQLAALTFARDLEAHPPAAVIGETASDAPRYEILELGAERRRVPHQLTAAFPAGGLAACPLVVTLEPSDWRDESVLFVHARPDDAIPARAWLDELLERSRRENPFQGRTLEAVVVGHHALRFKVVERRAVSRDDLVLPAAVWDEVDRNVHGLFAALDRLAAAGLAENRGVLLAGRPGTGKTLLSRVLAGEVPDGVTVVFCDGKAVAGAVRALYAELEHLAPALVIMEDIDLVVADRRRGGATEPLVDFLLALDGAISRHRGVVTVATTNDPAAIDAAAKRAARFDRLVEVPPPDTAGRAAILSRYLRSLPGATSVDAVRIAAATDGATGADLRELVTLAVLHTAGLPDCAATDIPEAETAAGRPDAADVPQAEVTTALLLRLAAEAGYQPPTGQYL